MRIIEDEVLRKLKEKSSGKNAAPGKNPTSEKYVLPEDARKAIPEAEKIEIEYVPDSLATNPKKRLPKYKIRSVDSDDNKSTMAVVYVASDRLHQNKGNYRVLEHFETSRNKDVLVGERADLADAGTLAYHATLKIGHQIASKYGLRLEDLTKEQGKKSTRDSENDDIGTLLRGEPMHAHPTSVLGFSFLSLIVGIALGVSSLNPTGNVVSNVVGASGGLVGCLLFMAGVLGIMYNASRK